MVGEVQSNLEINFTFCLKVLKFKYRGNQSKLAELKDIL